MQDDIATRTLKRENERLRRAVKELSVLNDLATAIGGAHDLETIMRTVIQRSTRAVDAAQGVITLVEAEAEDPMKTLVRTMATSVEQGVLSPDRVLLGWMQVHKAPLLINDPSGDERFIHTLWASSIRSILCVPMIVKARLVGVLTLYNKKTQGGFQETDSRLLSILAAQSAQVLENARLHEDRANLLQVFGQHTAPEVVEALLHTGTDLHSRRRQVCVMFLDIRGFTTFSEQRAPEAVVDYLNTLFDLTIAIINQHHGIIHQLLGDGFMAIFGAPLTHGNDCRNAVEAALAMEEAVQQACADKYLPPTNIGIGLHAGEVVAGLVGSAIHKEYKVTGDVVNLAARIEKMTKQVGGRVLISEAVWQALGDDPPPAEPIGSVAVRGREGQVALYRLS